MYNNSLQALDVPDIDSYIGLMHTLFALETSTGSKRMLITAWAEHTAKYKSGEISKEDYDKWRYRFPEFDTTQIWGKVPSKELSDALVEAFKDKLKD